MQEQNESGGIFSTIYYSANDIAQMLGISKSGAYSIIRKLNSELESRGYIVIQGKVSKAYFQEKWYGMNA
ncbi:MAG: ICEBs1 excisionase [Lachnospiraceae bacterium]|nr:ICEBs1 excisionase [Lachnospiraceae bacterium]